MILIPRQLLQRAQDKDMYGLNPTFPLVTLFWVYSSASILTALIRWGWDALSVGDKFVSEIVKCLRSTPPSGSAQGEEVRETMAADPKENMK